MEASNAHNSSGEGGGPIARGDENDKMCVGGPEKQRKHRMYFVCSQGTAALFEMRV